MRSRSGSDRPPPSSLSFAALPGGRPARSPAHRNLPSPRPALDFYYSDATGPAAGQALYSLERPTQALAYARGGTLA